MFKGLLFVASLAVVGGGGFLAGANKLPFDIAAFDSWSAERTPAAAKIEATGKVIYYRHPDGKPVYSAKPTKTEDGREFTAVRQSQDVSFDEAKQPPKTAADTAGAKKVLYYRNPMGLSDTSPVPKKDSMGMDYIPVFEGQGDERGIVKVSPGKLQRTGVRSVAAKLAKIGRRIRVPATIMLDERRIGVVAMRTDAFIETVSDVTTGDRVKKGDPLFQFFSKEIAAAGAELASEQASSNKSGGALRLRNFGLSPETIQAIARSRKVPDRIAYDSPMSGVVLERMATAGMMASSGQLLFRIGDTSKVWVVAEVAERQLDAIRKGAQAIVTVRSLPGKVFKGTVSLIYPEIRMETRTAKVRVELDNPDGDLIANMFADVAIASGTQTPVVSVPNSAIIDTGDRQVVFIDLGEGRFRPKDVKLGMRGEEETEVRQGIKAGDRVVVAANFLLDAESNLNSALNALTAGEDKP
ncbi:MAG: efflux transporter, family, subunit [Rhizobium sp.]|nr:efflux transporter, family, subunit [Rhizobium sp.]